MTSPLDLTQVDGVPVIARQTARAATPVSGDAAVPITGVDEVLLADNTTVFQCVRETNGCGKTFAQLASARAHLAQHSPKRRVRQLEAEKAARAANYRAGAVKGVETKRANREKAAAAPAGLDDILAATALEDLAHAADKISRGLGLIDDAVKDIGALVERVVTAKSRPVDPEIVEKAAKWDQFVGLMGSKVVRVE